MQLRVISGGSGWRVCSQCPAAAAVELESYDEPDQFFTFCLGCLVVKLLELRARLLAAQLQQREWGA